MSELDVKNMINRLNNEGLIYVIGIQRNFVYR